MPEILGHTVATVVDSSTIGTTISTRISDRLFKPGTDEARDLKSQIANIIDRLSSGETDLAVSRVIDFFLTLWTHFSVKSQGEMYLSFAKTEMALYGLELTEQGDRYRDHLIHVFNVFVTGLVIISDMLNQDEKLLWKTFKIKPESEKLPFPSRYDSPRRLYYLWMLASTLHDIALPVDHLQKLNDGLKRFYDHFKMEGSELTFNFPSMSVVKASGYFRTMDIMFNEGVEYNTHPGEPTYQLDKTHQHSPYFLRALYGGWEKRNHGVIGSFYLYDSLERTFLEGQHKILKYDLDVNAVSYRGLVVPLPNEREKWPALLKEKGIPENEWDSQQVKRAYSGDRRQSLDYTRYVLEQDITRAAVAIAIHNMSHKQHPRLFPISFVKLPITWFLIFLDEVQEFFRPEGLWLHSVIRFQDFPTIRVKKGGPSHGFKVSVDLNFKEPPLDDETVMISAFNKWDGKSKTVINYKELVTETWKTIFETLQSKLSFTDTGPAIMIQISVNGKPPAEAPLVFKSANWQD